MRNGTNLALLNAILHELIADDYVDHDFICAHTIGYDELVTRVHDCTPVWAAEIWVVPAAQIRAAAAILGTHDRVLSTCLQGVYQSHQATASAVQVNNINLLRGALGRPGAGILQMNGQPTAQNTRECGANGDLPAFRNWANDEHVQELAQLWNVDARRASRTTARRRTRCRSSATPSRARSAFCGSARRTRRSRFPSFTASGRSSRARSCSLSCRTSS